MSVLEFFQNNEDDDRAHILLLNALYGSEIGMYTKEYVNNLLSRALEKCSSTGSAEKVDFLGFCRALCSLSIEDESQYSYPAELIGAEVKEDNEETYVVVYDHSVFEHLAGIEDRSRFTKITGSFPMFLPSDAKEFAKKVIAAKETNSAELYLTIEPWTEHSKEVPKSFGPPEGLVWFTKKSVYDQVLDGVKGESQRANKICEVLGLGHKSEGSVLFSFFLPVSLIDTQGHTRPRFGHARGNPYFFSKAIDDQIGNPGKFGYTLDLGILAEKNTLESGAPERVARSFQIGEVAPNAKIHFEALGVVGRVSNAEELVAKFAKLWRGGRTMTDTLASLGVGEGGN